MCMGPKCPCIYPPMPHKEMKYITFRERSPIDRVMIKTQLNDFSKALLKKIKYTARPPQQIQYQIYALCNLLGEESDSWFRISKLFTDYNQLINKITQMDVSKLTEKQIEKSQHWLDEYNKLNKDGQVTVFADVAKGILSKIVQVEEEKHQELIKDLKDTCLKKYNEETDIEEAAVLSITQETFLDYPQRALDLSADQENGKLSKCYFESPVKQTDRKSRFINNCPPNSSTTLFCSFLDKTTQKSPLQMSFCRSPDKSFRDSKRTASKTKCIDVPGGVMFDDIVSLKKELEMIQKDITRLEGQNKKKQFFLNRSALRLKEENDQDISKTEFHNVRIQTQKDDCFNESLRKEELTLQRSHSAFRKELYSKTSPTNMQFKSYLEKYTSKYIPIIDRITQQQQELRSIKSQIQIASTQKLQKESK